MPGFQKKAPLARTTARPQTEVRRLLNSMAANPERTHLVGVYGLGKCQRLIKLFRQAGYDGPIYLHGALVELTKLYQRLGVDLGEIGQIDPAARSTKSSTTTAGRAASTIP